MKRSADANYKLFLLLAGLLYFFLEWFTSPTMGDDTIYHFQFSLNPDAPPQPIRNFGDLISSQVAHYFTINGRFPVHFLAQTMFAFVPDGVVDLLNTIVFVFMVYLCGRIITPTGRNRVAYATLLLFFIFVVIRGFQTAFLWQLGAFNYLWPITINLLLYVSLTKTQKQGFAFGHLWWLFPLALLAGWSHEALSLPVTVAMACYLWQHRKERNLSPLVAVFVLYAAGTALCLFSPGVMTRVGDNSSLAGRLVSAVVTAIFNVRVGWLLLITLIVAMRKKVVTMNDLRRNVWLILGILAAYGIVVLSGQTVIRVAFMADFMALVVMLALWQKLLTGRTLRVFTLVAAIVSAVFYVPALALCHEQTQNYRFALRQMQLPGERIVATRSMQPRNWLEAVVTDRYVQNFADYGIWGSYMPFDPKDSNNRCLARMFGKRKMLLLPEDVLNKMRTDSTAYRQWSADKDGKIYVWQLPSDKKVSEVKFLLKPEDVSKLHFWQRPVVYKPDSFVLDDFRWEVVPAFGRRYLVFTVPTTNVKRRIGSVELN